MGNAPSDQTVGAPVPQQPAANVSIPAAVPAGYWEWEEHGQWKPYDAASSIALDTAYQQYQQGGPPSVSLNGGDQQLSPSRKPEEMDWLTGKYQIDLSLMQQTNLSTGWRRQIRRTTAGECPSHPSCCVQPIAFHESRSPVCSPSRGDPCTRCLSQPTTSSHCLAPHCGTLPTAPLIPERAEQNRAGELSMQLSICECQVLSRWVRPGRRPLLQLTHGPPTVGNGKSTVNGTPTTRV